MPRTVHDRGEVRRSGRRRSSREHELKGVPDLAPLLCGVGLRSLEPRARKTVVS
jgi:hypothetical protein